MISGTHIVTFVEHPEDKQLRLEGEKYGQDHMSEFMDDHLRDIQLLIGSYDDSDAKSLLASLREIFWARLWVPRKY